MDVLCAVCGRPVPRKLRLGDVLEGFCNGYFGRDSYEDKTVEAIGKDWVIAREDEGIVLFTGDPQFLLQYLKEK